MTGSGSHAKRSDGVEETLDSGVADDATGSDSDSARSPKWLGLLRRPLPLWQEIPLLLAAGVVLALVLKSFFISTFHIPTDSMEPGLERGDVIAVQQWSYWWGEPERGEVVVFEDPGGWLGNTGEDGPGGFARLMSAIGVYPSEGHLVKRVVGVEGDVIECCDADGLIYINGEPLTGEDYLNPQPADQEFPCNGPMTGNCKWQAGPVPEGKIFVLGDHRDRSADSSYYVCGELETDCTKDPFVDTDLVVGKVFAKIWPGGRFGFVGTPDNFDDVPDPQ